MLGEEFRDILLPRDVRRREVVQIPLVFSRLAFDLEVVQLDVGLVSDYVTYLGVAVLGS